MLAGTYRFEVSYASTEGARCSRCAASLRGARDLVYVMVFSSSRCYHQSPLPGDAVTGRLMDETTRTGILTYALNWNKRY